ncbi:MAG: DUF2237 family protein [Chitinophagaceae bacterium]|nr:MAG: DUF2237 family protein [Chitinophagaceae bacterium]
MSDFNVFGEKLLACSYSPLTGFNRNGNCDSYPEDKAKHLVCVEISDEFLEFSYEMGNDLKSPEPEYDFPGLKAGDFWCVCAKRWLEAHEAGVAPKVKLESTNENILELISIDLLIKYAYRKETTN